MKYFNHSFLGLCVAVMLLAGCSTSGPDMSKGAYKVGKPYVINGKRYIPQVDYGYSETGLASWYGPGFHGKKTANGERFNKRELTAAHRTLPMPSIVRVTNLENGRSIVLRVNDRGPFAKNRIIDVSEKAAELLAFKGQGVAQVRVDILEQQSKRIADAAMSGADTRGKIYTEQPTTNIPPAFQTASTRQPAYKLVTVNNTVVPGHMTDGQFYPDASVTQEDVQPHQLFVQVGAFSTEANAEKLSRKIAGYGNPVISPVDRGSSVYYRVRLPAQSNQDAIDLMAQLDDAGYKNTQIVVE